MDRCALGLGAGIPLAAAESASRRAKAAGGNPFPPEVARISANYNHLHEQPTVFYAVLCLGTLAGAESPLAVAAAWAYVLLRVGHSLEQARHDRIPKRFTWFLMASVAHFVLTASVLWTWLA